MPVGTVRGRYELDAPALKTLRDLEKQGIRTQDQMDRLGRAMDDLGDQKDQQRLRDYGRQMGDFRRTTERTFRDVRREWVETTRVVRVEVGRQERAIDTLIAKLDILSAKRASPQIDVDGIAAAIAQVEVLHARINSLGNARATASVGVRGGGGGGPRLPVPNAGGGGGNLAPGGKGLRSVGFGPLNFGSAGGLALMAGALPAVVQLGGGAGALLGSAGMGALGAGAIAAPAIGGLATGAGLSAMVGVSAQGQINDASKAMEKFRDVIADYGRSSKEAARAKRELDQAMAAAPEGTRELLRMTRGLSREWARDTRPARNSYVGVLRSGLRAGNALEGTAARGANRVTGALDREASALSTWISGGTGQRAIRQGAGIFDENLGNMRGAGQNSFEAFLNVMQASRPFFREATDWLREWTRGWATGTDDIERTRESIGRMVDHLKSWMRLTGATGGLIGSLLGSGAPEGQRMVDDLTGTFDRWSAWLDTHPRQVQDFFRRSVDGTEQLAEGLWEVVRALGQIGDDLGPLLTHFMTLLQIGGQLGLLTPGAGALAYGAFRGTRGARGGGGGVGAAGGGGGASGGAAGGLGMMALASSGFANWRERGDLRRTGMAGATIGEREAARAALAAGAAPTLLQRGRSALRQRAFRPGSTYGLARSFGYGRAASAAAGVGAAGMAGGGVLRAGAMGAGRAYLPIGALFAGLDAYAYEGDNGGLDLGNRAQVAANSLLLGAPAAAGVFSKPRSRTQIDQQAAAYSGDIIGGLSSGRSTRGIRGDITDLRRAGQLVRGDDSADFGTGAERDRRIREVQRAFREEIEVRRQMAQDLRRSRVNEARERGVRTAREFEEGFERRSGRKGANRAAVFGDVIGEARGDLGKMGRHGGRAFATETLDWAQQAAKGNKAMEAEVDRLEDSIVRKFGGMARQVATINGRIYVGASNEWGRISEAISSAARRGVDETSAEFQRLRSVAVGALRDMGYSEKEARGLFRAQAKYGKGAVSATSNRGRAGRRADAVGPVGGVGQGDGIGDGLGDRRGARAKAAGQQSAATGGLMGANPGLSKYAGIAASYGLGVSSGRRPGAVTSYGNRSFHASGDALDLHGSPDSMKRFALDVARRFGSQLEELIYSPLGWSIKNGSRTAAYAVADHYDHVHIADTSPGAGGGGGAMGGLAGGLAGGGIHLNPRQSKRGGAVGALSNAARSAYARGIEARVNEMGGGGGLVGGLTGSIAEMVRQAGLPPIFNRIINAESGGDPHARNASGATGLTQIMWPLHRGIVPGATSRTALENPSINLAAARKLYGQSGLSPWAASRGGWGDGIGSVSRGVRGTGPQRRPARVKLGAVGGVAVSFAGASFHVRNDGDIEKIAEAVGGRILSAIRGDRVSEEAVNG